MTEAHQPEKHRPDGVEWQNSTDRFQLLVESVKDYGIFMLDPEGYVVSWNEGARRIKGYESYEIIGSHFSCFYPPEDLAWRKPNYELKRAVADGRFEDEGWRLRKDGSRFWADVVITALFDTQTGELRGFGKVTRDLTERKQAEERLRQSEEQLRLLVESVDEYAIFMLDASGHVMTWNAGAEKAKGYKAKEIIGKHFEQFYTQEQRAKGRPRWLLEQAMEKGHIRDQGLRVRKDGSTFQADVLITAVHDHEGKLRGFSKVTRDITDQVRVRDIEAARIAAERANKAKDDFLAVLSHELRTPLTPVLATVSYLTENVTSISREELVAGLDSIQRNARLEAQLIDDLLDLTRITRGKIELRFEAVDIHTAIRDAMAICQEDITSKELQLSCELDAKEHWVWADPTRIRQVLWNVLNNAVKFTPRGGRILIVSQSDAQGQISIEVTDSGIGIDPEQAARIFQAFEQGERRVTRQFGGLGLGLAITRNLVELHKGSISVQSDGKGKGATFKITLSSVPYRIAPVGVTPSIPEPARMSLRILMVDDHQDTRHILSRLLIKAGHRVQSASTVQEALTCLRTEPFDVLVSDIGLPDGSGLELMVKARQQHERLRGIALSGFGMQEDVSRSKQAGFDHHLTKPVDITLLKELLEKNGTE